MVPTLVATLGIKGHRPTVGTRDRKDLLDGFAVINLLTGAVHTNTLESPKNATQKTGKSKTKRMPEAFASPLRHVGRTYPLQKYPRVVLLIDNAPWHRGQSINEALRENPHLEFKRLPSYRPQWNPIERLWKELRRRATHNRLFDTLADRKASIRSSLCYFQTVRYKVKSIIQGRPKRKSTK